MPPRAIRPSTRYRPSSTRPIKESEIVASTASSVRAVTAAPGQARLPPYGKMGAVHPDVVLFDLDGTLTESGPGVVSSLRYAFDAIGVPPPDDPTLMRFVGPPLLDSFRDVAGLDDAVANDALVAYRHHFVDKGMFENAVYPGIRELLRALVDAGRRLAVATSKPLPYARPVVEHFALGEYFDFVCGPDLDGSGAVKTTVVADAMAALKVS